MDKPAKYDDHLVCERCDYTSPDHDEFVAELCQDCDLNTEWQCHQDGKPKGTKYDTYDGAWMAMFSLQGMSVAWATRYAGWEIRATEKGGEAG